MRGKNSGKTWWKRSGQELSEPERLDALAKWCEELPASEQRAGFERAIDELMDAGTEAEESMQHTARKWIGLLADSGAFESAAIAMIPRSAIYTGGRMADGRYVAQVILHGGIAANSRTACSLAMAWLAALLRAFARQSIEAAAGEAGNHGLAASGMGAAGAH